MQRMDTSLHYTSVNHANCLVSTINNLRRGGKLCDIVISAGDVRIPAHRLVLAAASPYFGPLLELAHPSPLNGICGFPIIFVYVSLCFASLSTLVNLTALVLVSLLSVNQ